MTRIFTATAVRTSNLRTVGIAAAAVNITIITLKLML